MSVRPTGLCLLVLTLNLAAQSPPEAPWPGLRLRDALEALRVIRLAGAISQEQADQSLTTHFLRSERDITMEYQYGDETMWFALLWKGQVIDPRQWWILYDGRLVNLAALFSYGEEFDPDQQAPRWTILETLFP